MIDKLNAGPRPLCHPFLPRLAAATRRPNEEGSGYQITVRADQKVFRNGPFILGFTSSFRMGQLLRYAFHPPDHDPRVEVERYMATTFNHHFFSEIDPYAVKV